MEDSCQTKTNSKHAACSLLNQWIMYGWMDGWMVYIDQNRINVCVYAWSDLNRMVVKEALP